MAQRFFSNWEDLCLHQEHRNHQTRGFNSFAPKFKVTLYKGEEKKKTKPKPGEKAALQNTVEKLPRHTPFSEQHPHPAADKCRAVPGAAHPRPSQVGEHLPRLSSAESSSLSQIPPGQRATQQGHRWDLGNRRRLGGKITRI